MKAIQESGAQGVHSDLVYRDEKGNIIRRWKMGEGDIRKGWLPGHPTLYLKREVYEEFGEFKEDYCCAADYEFMVRILRMGKSDWLIFPKN